MWLLYVTAALKTDDQLFVRSSLQQQTLSPHFLCDVAILLASFQGFPQSCSGCDGCYLHKNLIAQT